LWKVPPRVFKMDHSHRFIKEKFYQFVTHAKELEWGCSGIQVPCLAPASAIFYVKFLLHLHSLHFTYKRNGGTELRKGYTLEAIKIIEIWGQDKQFTT
jgi:hypothetical protein